MGNYPDRYIQLLDRRGAKFDVVNGRVFELYSNMVVPFGPACNDYTVTPDEAAAMLQKMGGLLVRWTDGFQDRELPWYAVICDQFKGLDELKSKYRSEINRGLKNCMVKRVDASYFASHFYDVYRKANEGYSNAVGSRFDEQQFRSFFSSSADFDDIVHFWGVFINNVPVAYSIHYVFDKTESGITSVKADPAYNSYYPSYALFYRLNEYYLHEQGFQYINDGFRSVLHDTNVQDFLEKKFNYRRAYTHLGLVYRPPLGLAVKLSYPLRNIIRKFDGRLNAIYSLEEFSRKK